jgi:hypothetical protein
LLSTKAPHLLSLVADDEETQQETESREDLAALRSPDSEHSQVGDISETAQALAGELLQLDAAIDEPSLLSVAATFDRLIPTYGPEAVRRAIPDLASKPGRYSEKRITGFVKVAARKAASGRSSVIDVEQRTAPKRKQATTREERKDLRCKAQEWESQQEDGASEWWLDRLGDCPLDDIGDLLDEWEAAGRGRSDSQRESLTPDMRYDLEMPF